MKEEVLFIQGTATGYFDPSFGYETGNYKFNELELYSVDVRNSFVIADTLLDEHCVGSYYKPNRYHNIRIFNSETEFIKARLRDFVIRDIQEEVSINYGEKRLIPFSGTFISCLIKPIPPKDKIVLEEPPDLKNNPGFVERYIGPIFGSFFNLKNLDGERLYGQQSFLASLIGLSILSIFFIGLASAFGLGLYGGILAAFFLIGILWDHLKSRFIWLRRFEIKDSRFLLFNIGLLLWLIAIPSILINGWQFGNFHLFLFGLWMFLINRKMNILRVLAWGVLLFQLIYFIGQVQEQIKSSSDSDDIIYEDPDDDSDFPESFIDTSDVILGNDTISYPFFVHKMTWIDNQNAQYNGIFKVRKDHFYISKINREQLKINETNSMEYWFQVYSNLSNEVKDNLDLICNEYRKIINERKLNRNQSADMIVTSIQNIPYYLVHELSHRDADLQYGGFITEYHRKGGPCLPNITFGLQSPTEFMGNFKGDCDTRSVLLYAVLNRLGFKTIILASDHYGHAIIGVAGNYNGKAIRYKGENYYTWETTSTGFRPGVLSNECGNLNYWYVALGN
jgi:hypothetical protein